MTGEINHKAWLHSAMGFIREKGLEGEFTDWCGGWRCRADSSSKNVVQIVDEQAEDDGLWFVAETAPEAYLQQELRRLHAAIEAAPQ